jgi:hypothetical protein
MCEVVQYLDYEDIMVQVNTIMAHKKGATGALI